MKKTVMIAAAVLCLFLFCACGHQEDSAFCGKYICDGAELGGLPAELSLYLAHGASLELRPGGTAILDIDGSGGKASWQIEGDKLSLDVNGVEYSGLVGVDEIWLSLPDSLAVLHLAIGAEAPVLSGAALLGDWYGWWRIENSTGDFADTWYDCCASLGMDSSGRLIFTLWDEDGSRAAPMAAVYMTPDGRSESGWFWGEPIWQDQWRLDASGAEFEAMVELSGQMSDFDYYICLRPWGTDWADVHDLAPDMLPFFYEKWYLPLFESGAAMPDKIGN